MSRMILASVIICAHNPKEGYLRKVLRALEAQTLDRSRWELLLVDNASKEALKAKWDLSWPPHGYHLREEKLGVSWARHCGIRGSHGEILVFVDDDNVVPSDYLEVAVSLGKEWHVLGTWGPGVISPEFEVEPP